MTKDRFLIDGSETNLIKLQNTYAMLCDEGCGICEKKGDLQGRGFIPWTSSSGQAAHVVCYKKIAPLEKDLKDFIYMHLGRENLRFQQFYRVKHIRAINAVRKACGEDSLLLYLQKEGDSALAHLFNTVGVKAVLSSKL